MAIEPPVAGFDIQPEPFNFNGNHTQLIAQLAEEVGYLRGVLDTLDVGSDKLSELLSTAKQRHSELVTIRRSSSVTGGAR